MNKFGKSVNFSIRNDEGKTPLDLAIIKKNKAIIKLICNNSKPQISSLMNAVETYQSDLVQIFNNKLKKSLENHTDLLLPIQRFIELSKEVESKNTTKES